MTPSPAQYRQLREQVRLRLRWLSLLRPKAAVFIPPDTAQRAADAYDFCRKLLDGLHACGVDDNMMLYDATRAVEATAALAQRQTPETVEAAWSGVGALFMHVHYASCEGGVGTEAKA